MPDLSFAFDGRTVIVTGAARGIGLALSKGFAGAGASVWMVDVDEDALYHAAESVGGHPACTDVTSTKAVQEVVEAAASQTGRIDVLVNNAGLLRDGILWKLDDADWNAVVDVSLAGTFRFTRACVPRFRERSYGRVINVTSYTGLHGNVGQAAYAAAKAGVIGFTKTAAKELARFGVTVNAISPNAITRMIESMPREKRDEILSLVALGRFAEPDEIAHGVMFLASEQAGYITGAVLPVDGGVSM